MAEVIKLVSLINLLTRARPPRGRRQPGISLVFSRFGVGRWCRGSAERSKNPQLTGSSWTGASPAVGRSRRRPGPSFRRDLRPVCAGPVTGARPGRRSGASSAAGPGRRTASGPLWQRNIEVVGQHDRPRQQPLLLVVEPSDPAPQSRDRDGDDVIDRDGARTLQPPRGPDGDLARQALDGRTSEPSSVSHQGRRSPPSRRRAHRDRRPRPLGQGWPHPVRPPSAASRARASVRRARLPRTRAGRRDEKVAGAYLSPPGPRPSRPEMAQWRRSP